MQFIPHYEKYTRQNLTKNLIYGILFGETFTSRVAPSGGISSACRKYTGETNLPL